MKKITNTLRNVLNATHAFRSGLADTDVDDNESSPQSPSRGLGAPTFDDRNWDRHSDRKTVNMGGLEIPLTVDQLNRVEKAFLKSAEYGDAATVRRLVDNAKTYGLNVNCIDAMGRGVLRIAIETEHIELLQMLLTYEAIELRDSLLHAISEEQVQSVELILEAQGSRTQKKNLRVGLEMKIIFFYPSNANFLINF